MTPTPPIIDFRLRPPLECFLTQFNFQVVRGEMHVHWPFFRGAEESRAVMESSTDLFINEFDEAGLAHGVIVGRSAPGGGQCSSNDELLAAREKWAPRFSLFAGVGPPDALNAPAVMRELVEQGFVGVSIEGALWGLHHDSPLLYPLYEAAAEAGLMVTLTAAQGVSQDDLSLAHPDPIRRVAKLIPETPLIVVHACWPWTTLACALAYECPNVYLLPDVYIAVKPPGWRDYVDAANTTLAEQMIFGSAYPIRPLGRAIKEYEDAGLTEAAFRAVMYDNAARLLKLDDRSGKLAPGDQPADVG